ncbi:MAG: histidinol-phosphate aminotransferase family protein [Deltaproteobacteria bacterium]|nr:histidinol-phosphate aminotransferase family protein [Deltaproteobacteria bacterium]
MSAPSALAFLRPDLPLRATFPVSQLPTRAKLDQNEAPFALPEELQQELLRRAARRSWNRYPQPAEYVEVRARFAGSLGLDPERVLLTVGGDQAIVAAYLAAGGPGRKARIFEPTYPIIAHAGAVTHTRLDRVVLGPELAVEERHLDPPTALTFLVRPNNPTGGSPPRELVVRALERPGLVFLDEAYADFAGESCLDLVERAPNLLVGRSLSKALLAGVRLGYAVGDPEVIAALERLLFAPYHLNALQLAVAESFPEIRPHLGAGIAHVQVERERVAVGLRALGLTVWPSRGNFLLFAVADAADLCQRLALAGVRVRDVSGLPGLGHHLRVTIGSTEENALFLEALRAAV